MLSIELSMWVWPLMKPGGDRRRPGPPPAEPPAPHAGDTPVEEDDVAILDLGREDIDDAGVGQKEVAGGVAPGDGDELFQSHLSFPFQDVDVG
jgi:hypothetical protein